MYLLPVSYNIAVTTIHTLCNGAVDYGGAEQAESFYIMYVQCAFKLNLYPDLFVFNTVKQVNFAGNLFSLISR